MITLARGHSLREAGVFSFESLSTDFILATLGLAVAAFWHLNPWLIPFAVAPLLLIHRSLAIPQLQAEARVDPKTGLYNARHFAVVDAGGARPRAALRAADVADHGRPRPAARHQQHLRPSRRRRRARAASRRSSASSCATTTCRRGSAARSSRSSCRRRRREQAFEIADRIRRAVAARRFEVETSSEPIRATISMGVAGFPRDGDDANELVHQADLAVYRAKLQGRNRVLDASDEPLLAQPDKRAPRLVVAAAQDERARPAARRPRPRSSPRSSAARPRARTRRAAPRFLSVPRRLALLVGLVGVARHGRRRRSARSSATRPTSSASSRSSSSSALGQVLSLEVEETGSISVSAVGALAAAAIIGPRAALALAVTMSAVEWSARRAVFHQLLFNVGALSLASLAAAAVFSVHLGGAASERRSSSPRASLAGLVYFVVNMGLVSIAVGVEGRESPLARLARALQLAPAALRRLRLHRRRHLRGVPADRRLGDRRLRAAAVPDAQDAGGVPQAHRSARRRSCAQAAETIQTQNVSLEQANRLLKERSTAAMESLSATVDARDAYTAGHSRRVQQLALAIGRELDLSHDGARARSATPRSSTTSASSASRTRSC